MNKKFTLLFVLGCILGLNIEISAEPFEEYYHILPQLINQFNYKVGCEVGVAWAGHSYSILKNTKVSKLYSVDPWLNGNPNDYPDALSMYVWENEGDNQYNKVQERLAEFKDRSTILRLKSVEASALFDNSSLDFVFIDAIHTYEAGIEDLNSWYDKVKEGGIISGDDYTPEGFPGLVKAIDEFFSSKGLLVYRNSQESRFWWVYKKFYN